MTDRIDRVVRICASRTMMGLLIAVSSIFSAVCSYGNVTLESKATLLFGQAQEKLAFADAEYLFSNLDIQQDENLYNEYSIALLQKQSDVADYYKQNFSDELQSSFYRTKGPFDTEYYNNMVARAEEGTKDALSLFKKANEIDDASDRYAQAMLILSIGLSLAAWGSLFDHQLKVRAFFCLVSLALLVLGTAVFLFIPFTYLTIE